MKILCVLLCCLMTGALAAQTAGPAPSAAPAPLRIDSTGELALLMKATEPAILLQPYDFVSVHVYGADALAVKARIAPNGTLELPLAGPIPLSGMTVDQAQQAYRRASGAAPAGARRRSDHRRAGVAGPRPHGRWGGEESGGSTPRSATAI